MWVVPKPYNPLFSISSFMKIGDGCGLSPRKVEYLKYLHSKGGRVRTTDIARDFAVDPSTITKTITDLCAAGLVTHEPYHGISLSDAGRQYAEYLIKRHRILSLMLTHYGFSHEQACAEALRFESFVTKEAIDRICTAMGHPRIGVCGAITHEDGCLETGTAP
jgi:Mn-dependent DtxR family transcriptional regulator